MWTRTVVLAATLGVVGLVAQPTPAKAGFFDSFGLALSHLGQMVSQHGTSVKPATSPTAPANSNATAGAATPPPVAASAADHVPVPLVAATDLPPASHP